MTIIRNEHADRFVSEAPDGCRLFLVHGTDEGLIHERASRLATRAASRSADTAGILRLEAETLARDPGRLADEAYAISLFGGSAILWIDAGNRDLTAALAPIFERGLDDGAIVVEAGNLKKGGALRALFETSPKAAAIECYPDDARQLAHLIDSEIEKAGLKIEAGAKQHLLGVLGSDRLASRGELAKLRLFVQGRQTIESSDVEAVVSEAAPSAVDALVDVALLGEVRQVEFLNGRFFREGGDVNLLLNRLISRMGLLLQIRREMDEGRTFDSALQGLFVRIANSGRAALQKQAELWTAGGLRKRLPVVLALTGRCRRQADLAPILAARALWALASSVRAGARG